MKLVVFDCDGTLVDSQHMIVAAMERAFAGFALLPPGRAEVLSVVGLSLEEAVGRLAPADRGGDVPALADAYKQAFGELRRDKAHAEPLYPGVREALLALAEDPEIVLGVATGKSRRGLAAVLEREGLTGLFATLQTADTHPSKPDPAMLRAAMTETGANADRTVMIGDTTYDIEMAIGAGTRGIGVAWGYHPVAELEAAGAHSIVDDSQRLQDHLGRFLQDLDR